MRTSRLTLLAALFLFGEGCALAQTAPAEKDALIDSYEGFAPELTKFAVEGQFDAKRPFGLEIVLQAERWVIKFRYAGAEARIFTLPSTKYPSLHFERTFVVTRSPSFTDPHILVVIPFGEPQTGCFLNGEDVFRHVILAYDADKLVSVEERVFKDCNEQYRQLPL